MKNKFEDILAICNAVHSRHPEWRFGQVIANAVREIDGRVNCDPFHISDDQMLRGLDNLLDDER
jgi:hypothetical protein